MDFFFAYLINVKCEYSILFLRLASNVQTVLGVVVQAYNGIGLYSQVSEELEDESSKSLLAIYRV